ncbi:MAG: NAD(+)/NADH kinase [Candidatus Competibacter sp.]
MPSPPLPRATATPDAPLVGLIANPVSARDIRRIVANASNLQLADRVNIVLRALATLAATGVTRVLMMPDRAGIRAMLSRHLQREHNLQHAFPQVEFLDLEPTSTVDDTFLAARLLREAGAAAIIVLGGDGTHRAVVRELIAGADSSTAIPIAGLSTGTNNAFPELRESSVVGLAVGLYATGRLSAGQALASNKLLDVSIQSGDGIRRDIALVDAAISTDRYIGARALWKPEGLHSVFLTFAEPHAIGLSSIGGLLHPIARDAPGGLAVRLAADPARRRFGLLAPIAPGMAREIGIEQFEPMPAGRPFAVDLDAGVVALDGERELAFESGERVTVTLRENAFRTVDIARCMRVAATAGLFRLCS